MPFYNHSQELNPTKPSSVLRAKVLENFALLSSKARAAAEGVLRNIQDFSTAEVHNLTMCITVRVHLGEGRGREAREG